MKVILCLLTLLFITGCEAEYPHKFAKSDCVEIALTGEKAMIVGSYKYHDMYSVRVARASKTNSALFGADNTENQRYALVYFHEFELRQCE